MNQIEIQNVNKYQANWSPHVLFRDFSTRVIFKDTDYFVLRIILFNKLRQKLLKDIGEEDGMWYMEDQNTFIELYLKNPGILLIWKLQNLTEFIDPIIKVENHSL